ncbi:MAG: DUF937 domain-containing protein [Oscillospiraceae bacterium]|jgi:hypothetical protein|nr:DUF937 domain-containing protein [Oscillospiraceae bacterium]
MDLTSLVNTMMSNDSLEGISQLTNTSNKETKSVLSAALPLLLNGAQAQSQNASTASGFGNALFNHGQQDTSNVSSFLQGVDMEDGGKIIGHLLGLNTNNAMNQIAMQTGVSNQNTGNILSAAAPLLMSLLGQQLGSNNANATPSLLGSLATSAMGGMNMNSLLGGLLGGGTQQVVYQQPVQQQKPSLLSALLNLFRG